MNYFLIQPYFKLFYPFKSVRFLNFSLFNFIFAKKKQLTFLLLALSLLLGIIYVLEFNLVLNLGKNIAVLNMELKKTIFWSGFQKKNMWKRNLGGRQRNTYNNIVFKNIAKPQRSGEQVSISIG